MVSGGDFHLISVVLPRVLGSSLRMSMMTEGSLLLLELLSLLLESELELELLLLSVLPLKDLEP